ncbi:hypothetical protein [Streptomyces sp. NPDC046870]|uniref:hypothetical protein n=1 Tax=Streptomyces sp. NPDC046870 TaxID=3155135 RepID=UPI0034550C8F
MTAPAFWRYWQPVVTVPAGEQGFCEPTRERSEKELDRGALFAGSPQTVAGKIANVARDPRPSRFGLTYAITHLPLRARDRRSELLGREVAPRVREPLSKESAHV